jgi:hypothetical protein
VSAAACVLAIHLAAGDAAQTITQLSQQVHNQVLFNYHLARGNATPALDACFGSPGDAIEALLKGTELEWIAVNAHTLGVRARLSVLLECPAGTRVHVAAGEAAQTLDEVGRQAHATLQFARNVLVGQHTAGIDGCYSAVRALSDILNGTNLTWTQVNVRTFHIYLRGSSASRGTEARHRSPVRTIMSDSTPIDAASADASPAAAPPPGDLVPSAAPLTLQPLPKVLIRGYPNEFKGTDYDYHRDWACAPAGRVERCVLRHAL